MSTYENKDKKLRVYDTIIVMQKTFMSEIMRFQVQSLHHKPEWSSSDIKKKKEKRKWSRKGRVLVLVIRCFSNLMFKQKHKNSTRNKNVWIWEQVSPQK